MNVDVRAAAELLLDRETRRFDGPPLTDTTPFDIVEAYAIQDATLDARLARGETLVGVKLGLTSRAKQERMGVDAPFVAWLTDAMVLPLGVPVPAASFIHPRVEPEIAFVMGEDLSGPGVSAARAMRAVASVHAAFEVIDSRYTDFRFTAPDVIADNASSGAFVLNPTGYRPDEFDLALESVIVESRGAVVATATGAAVLNHPGEALALAANSIASRGHRLRAGDVVITGGLTDAFALDQHPLLTFEFARLGSLYCWSDDAVH